MPTSYAQTIFVKPLDEITEADLTNYFQQERDETLNLEFKSYTDKLGDARSQSAKDAEKIKGVLKTIDAFLNSSGGLLIWGAPEPTEVKRGEKKVKMCQGVLAPVPKYYDRDDFINKIAGQISPVPAGVRMQPVPVAGGYVYLFDVPESQNKPHQNDGRYYVRMDTRTDAAPHYLVYALCHQIKTPTLKLDVSAESASVTLFNDRRYLFVEIKIALSNRTPFIHELDAYTFWTSKTLIFAATNDITKAKPTLNKLNVASLLPLGLQIQQTNYVYVPLETVDQEHSFRITYGGRQSLATAAVYKLTVNRSGITIIPQVELTFESKIDDPSMLVM